MADFGIFEMADLAVQRPDVSRILAFHDPMQVTAVGEISEAKASGMYAPRLCERLSQHTLQMCMLTRSECCLQTRTT